VAVSDLFLSRSVLLTLKCHAHVYVHINYTTTVFSHLVLVTCCLTQNIWTATVSIFNLVTNIFFCAATTFDLNNYETYSDSTLATH